MIEQYMALALQPIMRGCQKRSEIIVNLRHISELIDAAVWLSAIDLPVRLVTHSRRLPARFHRRSLRLGSQTIRARTGALISPATRPSSSAAKRSSSTPTSSARPRPSIRNFPRRFFNAGFVIAPTGEVIHKHYKLQVFAREHSTVPHDVWDRWVELYGDNLDAFFPVVDTDIGRIGIVICMEGSFPETARGVAMNGAEVIYRPAYPEPYVANDIWEIQNRARALDNTCYVVAPNPATYYLTQDSLNPIDTFGGKSMIVDYQGRVLSKHDYGSGASYAGAIIDIEALRQYRSRSLWGNWMRDLRTEQFRCIYEQPIYPKNLCMKEPPGNHEDHDEIRRNVMQDMMDRGLFKPPTHSNAQPASKKREKEEVPAD